MAGLERIARGVAAFVRALGDAPRPLNREMRPVSGVLARILLAESVLP